MDHNELRLECLKLARRDGLPAEDIIAAARKMMDFILGTRDAEIIKAARDLGDMTNRP